MAKSIFSIFSIFCLFISQDFYLYATSLEKNDVKVSIVVPVYNSEQYLEECIDSLINQTLKEIEIICVDDGSPDNCGKILDNYSKKDNRMQIIHQKNSGPSSARNKGMDLAKGEYIMFVDSDDILHSKTCEICYSKAKETDADILFYNNVINAIFNEPQFGLLGTQCGVIMCMYKAKFIKNNNIRFNEATSYAEDQAFNMICNPRANKIVCIQDKLYTYRKTNINSLCHNKKVERYKDHCEAIKGVYSDWVNNGYFSKNTAKIKFLKWFVKLNFWPNNKEISKELLKSIGPELLDKNVINLLPIIHKFKIKRMISLAKIN